MNSPGLELMSAMSNKANRFPAGVQSPPVHSSVDGTVFSRDTETFRNHNKLNLRYI
jgi:hypothetical protein